MQLANAHIGRQMPVAAASSGARWCRAGRGVHRKYRHPGYWIALGVISLGPDFLQPAVSVHQGWWRYWQKHGLSIRSGHQTVTITVPEAWRNRAAITWGANVGIVSTLRLPGCPSAPGTWNGYAGGFYLRSSSACVPLVFAFGRHSAVVRTGVGRRCGPAP
jgi:hypothetical protein